MSLSSDFQKLSVSGLVTLYELDASNLGLDIMRWHGHVSYQDWVAIFKHANKAEFVDKTEYVEPVGEEKQVKQDIIWQGNVYSPVAIQSVGLEVRGDGRASMPTISIANNINGIQGALSALCLRHDDLAGAKLTVYTTLAKYLDAENFSDGNPQASDDHKKQLWFIEQKTNEDGLTLTFELSNPVDFEGQRIPCREITSYCHWAAHGRYRLEECGYTGAAMYDENDEPTNDPSKDTCPGYLKSCKIRQGEDNPLSYGGFPSASLLK